MNAGSGMLTLTFGYGTTANNGNVLSQQIVAPGSPSALNATQYYLYDELNRLGIVTEGAAPTGVDTCGGSATWCRDYGYDRYGNRAVINAVNGGLSAATPTATSAYTASTNRLTSSWANYDAAGNITAFVKTGYEWSAFYDAENKQRFYCGGTTAACSSANDTAEYVYDGEGNRVKKIASGETVTYVYDAFGRLAAEYSTAGPSGTPGSYFRTTDHLGSTRLVTDGSGAVHDRRDFFPFGEKILASSTYSNRHYVSGYNNSNPASDHLFTAKERDDESGLDYFGARYMSSSLGRFTSVDPVFATASLFNPQSWNGYAYVLNNPHGYVDPSGEVPIPLVTGAIGAGVGALVGGGAEAVNQYVRTGSVRSIQWGNVGTAALGGAVAGGIAGATFGIGSAAGVGIGLSEAIAVNAASSTVGGIVQRTTDESLGLEAAQEGSDELTSVMVDAITGGAGGAVGVKIADKVAPIPNVRREIQIIRSTSRGWKTRSARIQTAQTDAQIRAGVNSVVGGATGGVKSEVWKTLWNWVTTQERKREPIACVDVFDSATGDRTKSCE